jgi:hypothetical protein
VVTGITPNDVTMHILVSITEVVIIHSKKHISYDKNRLLPKSIFWLGEEPASNFKGLLWPPLKYHVNVVFF